jgi:hypothetical protein
VAGVAVAAVVAWYALTLRDRLLGGALLLGWYSTMALGFLQYYADYSRHRLIPRLADAQAGGIHLTALFYYIKIPGSANITVAVLGAAGIALTVIYMRRGRAASAVG